MLSISQILKISKKFKKGNSIDAQKLFNNLLKKNKKNYIALFETANYLNYLEIEFRQKNILLKQLN